MEFVDLLKFRLAHAKKEILFFIALSFLLIVIQVLFFSNALASTGIFEFLYLSNFVNKAWENCIFNIVMMLEGAFLILISTNTQFKRAFWFSSVCLILIISPFVLSFLNLIVIFPIVNNVSLGYSGIAAIFLGYGFIAISMFAYDFWKIPTLPKRKIYLFYVLFGIFLIIPIANFAFFADPVELSLIGQYGLIDGIYQTFIQTKINIFIHIVGYIFGLFVPFVSTIIYRMNSVSEQFSSADFHN